MYLLKYNIFTDNIIIWFNVIYDIVHSWTYQSTTYANEKLFSGKND